MTHSVKSGFSLVIFFGLVALTASCGPPGNPTVTPLAETLPAQVGGTTLKIQSFTGAQIADPKSAGWTSQLASIGATAADLSLALSTPAYGATSDFSIGVFRIANTDWNARFNAYVAAVQAKGTYQFSQVTLGGKAVWRGQSVANPTGPKGYYYVAGDTLFFLSTSNEAEAAEAFGKITPGSQAAAVASLAPETPAETMIASSATDLAGSIMITVLIPPLTPYCVGEPFGRTSLQLLATATGLIPDTSVVTSAQAPANGAYYIPNIPGPMPTFYYRAFQWGLGAGEQMTFMATSLASSATAGPIFFFAEVDQCLNGIWNDSDRTLQIDQHAKSVTAKQTTGALTCGAPGLSFSGTYNFGLSGSDLVICNPAECVSAGFLDRTTQVSYTGVLDDSGSNLTITWNDLVYAEQFDEMGNLTSCTQTGTSAQSFQLTRSLFGPGVPY